MKSQRDLKFSDLQLLIGNYGLSYDQSVSQMTIWSILAAPLLISADLDAIKPEFKEILLNREAIAINQDSLGKPGRRQLTAVSETINIWLRQLSNEDVEKASYALGFVSYRTDGYIYRYNTTLQSCGILQEGTPDTTTAKYTITVGSRLIQDVHILLFYIFRIYSSRNRK